MRGSRASSGAFKPHLTPTPHCLNGLVRAVVCKRVLGNVCRHFPLSQLGVGGAMHPVGGGQGCLLHILQPQDRLHEKYSWKVRASSKRPPEVPGCSTYPLWGERGESIAQEPSSVGGREPWQKATDETPASFQGGLASVPSMASVTVYLYSVTPLPPNLSLH